MTGKIKDIKAYCAKLISSNILVLDREISVFLGNIAGDEKLLGIIRDSNINYSLNSDFEKFKKMGKIVLPPDGKQLLAFAVGLLFKIDLKEISSIDILSAFYPAGGDLQQSFIRFCEELLIPMQEAFIMLLKGEPSPPDKEQNNFLMLDKMNEDIIERLQVLKNKVEADVKLESRDILEINVMVKGFEYILENKDIYIKKLVWLGLKNTLMKCDLFYNEILEIEKLFRLYGLDMEL